MLVYLFVRYTYYTGQDLSRTVLNLTIMVFNSQILFEKALMKVRRVYTILNYAFNMGRKGLFRHVNA